MPLKREPFPLGPIRDLFDRLHDLHLSAGEPGVRQMATGIGRGVLSYTTVHNVFKGPRVPKWGHLELIVEQLGGDIDVFRTLWVAARRWELSALEDLSDGQTARGPETADSKRSGKPRTDTAQVVSTMHASSAEGRRSGFVIVEYHLPTEHRTLHKTNIEHGLYRTRQVTAALYDVAQTRQGIWVGWLGRVDESRSLTAKEGLVLEPVEMSEEELQAHYEGYCNSSIWPLYHDHIERPEFRPEWHEANRVVNQRFAEAAVQVSATGGLVWIHDYQLQLVPQMLRRKRPDLRIGFFLHIPFPSEEMFLRLPGREEVLRGLLGADLVGFQRHTSVQNFIRAAARLLKLETTEDSVIVDGRKVVVDAFPVSVDVARIEQLVGNHGIRQQAKAIRTDLGSPKNLLVSIDRLDYTKGIEEHLAAYGALLRDDKLPRDLSAFIQVATLTRERIARYAQLRERVARLAGDLNSTYGRVGHPVVHYTHNVHDLAGLAALYTAADVMVVTPLKDGMNLVAKEYVASRTDNQGVLILSEFAGAAAELDGALLINPHDVEAMKSAMLRAIAMNQAEQGQRMRAMRRHVRKHNIQEWIAGFLAAIDRAAAERT